MKKYISFDRDNGNIVTEEEAIQDIRNYAEDSWDIEMSETEKTLYESKEDYILCCIEAELSNDMIYKPV